jgi:cyclopropane fatty-acyl-phospholipid synthase-like methyltransferase
MHRNGSATTEDIRRHYDRLSSLYRTFWGDHIHHGLWEGAHSAKEAQLALIQRLAAMAEIRAGSSVLDVGCGLGGSSIWLARHIDCSVLGLTISPVQLKIATKRAAKEKVAERVQFRLEDANRLHYENSFDCVWIIECSEHLLDKSDFFRRVGAALKPGGVLALCAWLISDGYSSKSGRDVVSRVCRGMQCPSLGTQREYCKWIEDAGLSVRTVQDMTAAVSRTWEACRKITQKPVVRGLLKAAESDTIAFVKSFADIAEAYAAGAMAYGMFAAVKQ